MTHETRRAAHRRHRSGRGLGNTALTGTGLLVGMWLGLTAPSISPVAGPAPSMHSASPAGSGPTIPLSAGR
jgi:hypothetical protein